MMRVEEREARRVIQLRIGHHLIDISLRDPLLGIVDAWRNPFPLSVDHMRYDACTADQDVRLGLEEAATVVRGQAEQPAALQRDRERSEEHTSELQSLMRISYA